MSRVDSGADLCSNDIWQVIDNGIRQAWQHSERGLVVEIVPVAVGNTHGHMLDPENAQTDRQLRVSVRPGQGEPTCWPRHFAAQSDGREFFSDRMAAHEAAEDLRKQIHTGSDVCDLEVTADE